MHNENKEKLELKNLSLQNEVLKRKVKLFKTLNGVAIVGVITFILLVITIGNIG